MRPRKSIEPRRLTAFAPGEREGAYEAVAELLRAQLEKARSG
jgi:hypothetical protein